MYYMLKIIFTSLAIFAYTVYSNNNNDNKNFNDNHYKDQVNIDNELNENQNDMGDILDENDKAAMDELFSSGLFKFLEDIDDEAIMDGKDQYIGKANENTYCYVKDEDPYHLFSTKTHYPAHNDSSHLDPVPGCEIVYVWMVMRHGIRYGSRTKTYEYYNLGKIRDEIVTNAGQKKTDLCMDDLFNFLLWMPILPGQKPIEPETLTENGYQMVKEMAKLLKEKFPHLIPNEYNPNKMKIDFSDEIKVNKTVEALTEELFGNPFVPPTDPDGVLEKVYQDDCRRPATLDRETGMNYTYLTQNSNYVNKMIEDVSVKLGFDTRLTYRDVSKMYDGCQYEIAWGHDRSPWCAVFTKDHLKIMEYISDISYYYFCGPGDVYNYFQGCVILKDLLENLVDAAKNEKRERKMSLLLGHSTTVLLLVTQLGLVDDPKLTHKNYFELEERKWRTSFLAPYTGNIMAILHRCSDGEKYRVKFLLNEKPFIFNDICDENYLCSLEKLYQLFEAIIKSEECSTRYCQHTPDEMCKYLKFDPKECEILKAQLSLLEEKLNIKREDKQKKIEDSKEQKEEDVPKEFITLEKEYRHACALICVCMIVIIGMFCKMSRVFPRIFRRTKNEPKKEIKKSKSEENNTNVKEGNKNKTKDKNITKNVEDTKTKTKNKTTKEKNENKKDK